MLINYDNLAFDPGTNLLLSKLRIDFVFQPIFELKTMKIVAYEALMRHEKMSPTELIDEYGCTNHLHIIELASLFGATRKFLEHGYYKKLCGVRHT